MNGKKSNPAPPKLPTMQHTEACKLPQSTSAFDLLQTASKNKKLK